MPKFFLKYVYNEPILSQIRATRYSPQLPGYSSSQKSNQLPGYPGTRYSPLETLYLPKQCTDEDGIDTRVVHK